MVRWSVGFVRCRSRPMHTRAALLGGALLLVGCWFGDCVWGQAPGAAQPAQQPPASPPGNVAPPACLSVLTKDKS
jgi:hypothetical protein